MTETLALCTNNINSLLQQATGYILMLIVLVLVPEASPEKPGLLQEGTLANHRPFLRMQAS
jgi:hypothetical protein